MPKDLTAASVTPFDRFARSLVDAGGVEAIRAGLIGEGHEIVTPFGTKTLTYADYTASGRALMQIEQMVLTEILPVYSNSHTEASHCGQQITRMRAAARAVVARETGAEADCHVIFGGSGATAGLNRLVALADVPRRVARGEDVRVIHGPFEHHSNLLPWRESGAKVTEIPRAACGGVDLDALAEALAQAKGADLVIGTFSAASNVTGEITDVQAVTRMLKEAGALSVWDYACAGPYLPMQMTEDGVKKDAIVFSPHKFVGGPGASGVLVVRDTMVCTDRPTQPGGGTVQFTSPWAEVYSPRVEAREEAGTPNVLGDIRAALALEVKRVVGTEAMAAREHVLRARALAAWADLPGLRLLSPAENVPALPIFSFQVTGAHGLVHPQLVTRMLSDMHGVQARGGCACAGPFAHRLLGIDRATSEALQKRLAAGDEMAKPGWTRLNLGWCHDDAQADRIIAAVRDIVLRAESLAPLYTVDPATARWRAA
ncbi:aminotransferase class V-fold PLP-dependent enzyme [Pararhodobacter marinus]|uniref:aminotransferase class V-fold PLP-dependent enzyme n=1 Tax=Pararhodobacter marinus TaxID=2184063 RepID=UPI003512BF1E